MVQLNALVAELRSQLAEAHAAVRTKGAALAEMELRLIVADRQVFTLRPSLPLEEIQLRPVVGFNAQRGEEASAR